LTEGRGGIDGNGQARNEDFKNVGIANQVKLKALTAEYRLAYIQAGGYLS